MKSINWNGLYANKFKKIGLIFAAIFIFIDLIARFSNMEDKSLLSPAYFIIYSLIIAMFSKEKIEDERIKIIRYFSLKQTFSIVILTVLLTILVNKTLHYSNFSYYSIIIPMLCYFPIFELVNIYNPAFIFKEGTSNKASEQLTQMALSVGVVMSIISLVINFLK